MLDKDGKALLGHIEDGHVAVQRNEEDKVNCESCQNHLCDAEPNNVFRLSINH